MQYTVGTLGKQHCAPQRELAAGAVCQSKKRFYLFFFGWEGSGKKEGGVWGDENHYIHYLFLAISFFVVFF